ncbi:MAG TPA: tyrosine-type recombinase/integrase [Anaeromyxobacteraceae bacterium]|nr:tyrosine-type recombinase/integrase [Anaeromyxobacteraceae bacterium]
MCGKIPDARRAFATAAKAAGLVRVWRHLFRHLCASEAPNVAPGADLRDAGGWSSSRMVDRYTHSRLARLRELIEGEEEGRTRHEVKKEGKRRAGRSSLTARSLLWTRPGSNR